MTKKGEFNGFTIIENDLIPEGTIYMSPADRLLFTDPEKWAAIKNKESEHLRSKVDAIFGKKD